MAAIVRERFADTDRVKVIHMWLYLFVLFFFSCKKAVTFHASSFLTIQKLMHYACDMIPHILLLGIC